MKELVNQDSSIASMGKGSTARPFSVTQDEFADAWERIFKSNKEVKQEGQQETEPTVSNDNERESRQNNGI
jgi:hypothetical protein